MPALTKRQIHPIAQIVLDDPGHRPELLLDPLRYQTTARSIRQRQRHHPAAIGQPPGDRGGLAGLPLSPSPAPEMVMRKHYRIVVGMLQ